MSSSGLPRGPVDDDPKATTGGPKPVPDSAQRIRQRDALVALNEVINSLILEQSVIQNEIIRQRAILAHQTARLDTTEANIQALQHVWEDMAAAFGITAKK